MGQNLSIGARCDTKAIVEHELLHALGFYHEQSRSDRDDYVKIWWDQIEDGELQRVYSISEHCLKETTHSYTDGTAIKSNLGLSILPKDTSTCGLEEPEIKPLI